MSRLLTAAVGVPIALAALFRLPGWAFFLAIAVAFTGAAWEFSRLARAAAPAAPWWALVAMVPAVAAVLAGGLEPGGFVDGALPLAVAAVIALGAGALTLAARTPVEQAPAAIGGLAFGVPYFAAPIAALYGLQQRDPWLVFLLLAIVWLGDTAAYYVGSAWGRHKLAPAISPGKSWEGAVAGFVVSVASTAIWSLARLERLDPVLLAIGALTALASQAGDLVESLVKRAAGVKDSGDLLPGHGGLYDRLDAMLFAAPALLLLLRAARWGEAP
jgi:phosphatidate cytidylyltransferase